MVSVEEGKVARISEHLSHIVDHYAMIVALSDGCSKLFNVQRSTLVFREL